MRYIDLTGHAPGDLAEAAERAKRTRTGNTTTYVPGAQGGFVRSDAPAEPVRRERADNSGYERPRAWDEEIRLQAEENEAQRQWWESQRAKIVTEDEPVLQRALRAEAEFEAKLKHGASDFTRTHTEDALKPAEHGALANRHTFEAEGGQPVTPNIAKDFQQHSSDITGAGAYGLTALAIEGGKFVILDGAGRVVGEVADAAAAKAFIRESEAAGETRLLAKEAEAGTAEFNAAKRGPKPAHTGPHNLTVDDIGAGGTEYGLKPGERLVAGGGQKPERLVPTPGGYKEGRRPDVLIETPSGELRGVNVGKVDAKGNPIPREQQALEDLRARGGIPTDFVPYDPTRKR